MMLMDNTSQNKYENQINIDLLFPTVIGRFQDINFTNRVLEISGDILDKTKGNNFLTYHQLDYSSTFRDQEITEYINSFSWIKEYLLSLSYTFIDTIGYSSLGELDVQAFFSRMTKGDKHPFHVHDNSVLSGVAYLETNNDCAPIIFEDPRKVRHFNQLVSKETPQLTNNIYESILPKKGEILIWESWLSHSVDLNECDCRETLVFNIGRK